MTIDATPAAPVSGAAAPDHAATERRQRAAGFLITSLVIAISMMVAHRPETSAPSDLQPQMAAQDANALLSAAANPVVEASALERIDATALELDLARVLLAKRPLVRAEDGSPILEAERARMAVQSKLTALHRLRLVVGARKAPDDGPESLAPLTVVDLDPGLFGASEGANEPRQVRRRGQRVTLSGPVPLPRARPALDPIEQAALKRTEAVLALGYAPARQRSEADSRAYAALDAVIRQPAEEPEIQDEPSVEAPRGFFGRMGSRLPARGEGVAIYDITNQVVHMPDGSKLEAHSGLGQMVDDPRYVHKKGRGPTPPNVYNLRMRERLFHGVEAIRMLPVNGKIMHGRDGILAHSQLRRGGKGSAGCIAFANYPKFLKAFKAGKVRQIVVVPHMKELGTYMAMR